MAQIVKQPLLSLCIPIYNRLAYLERQLARMIEDKDLFEDQIQLIISDNCSTDSLQSCCEKYQQQGLRLLYHRNETNIGPDGNFDWCFQHADGKYVWLLGSDDVPLLGVLRKLVNALSGAEWGLAHLSIVPRTDIITNYHKDESILADINVWITFISSNIIRTDSVRGYNLSDYVGSFMIQVPAYLKACLSADDNAIIYLGKLFDDDSDGANNGGYNLFRVFVENLFGIYQRFVDAGMMSRRSFELIKRKEYHSWLVDYVVRFLIFRMPQRKNFKLDHAWTILRKYYGGYYYTYYYTVVKVVGVFSYSVLRKVLKPIYAKFSRKQTG